MNLTYSSIARKYFLREGLPPDLVIKTGSPMFEVLTYYRPRIDASDVLTKLALTPQGFFLVARIAKKILMRSTHPASWSAYSMQSRNIITCL